jgi:putative Holliday junction resolvase
VTVPGDAVGNVAAGAPRGRLLAIDYGERRVGLAISDPLGMIASPAGVIVRRPGKRPPIAEIVRRAEATEARGFVVGLPLDGAGDDTPRAVEVRRIAADLARRTGLPTYLVDERYTTAAALRGVRESGSTTRDRKADIDALAAAVILRHTLALGEAAFAAARVEPAPDPARAASGIVAPSSSIPAADGPATGLADA